MKLGEILTGRSGGVYEAPTRKVKFKVFSRDENAELVVSDAEAVLAFVSEDERSKSRVQAEANIQKENPGASIPPDVIEDERLYFLLQRALKDSDDHRQPFALNAIELKRAIHRRTVADLYQAYTEFCADEFPEQIDDETYEQLLADAKKKSLADLLSSGDSKKILRALPFLVAHFGKSPTETSGAG